MAAATRFLLPAILLFLFAPPGTTEGRRKTRVIDIPRLTVEGDRPLGAKPGEYFFLDEATGDLVLDYPSDLVIHSRNLPGIVTAYFQGKSYKVWTSASAPRALSQLVPAFNFIETNSVSMPVIGPKFEPTTLVETRVCDIVGDVKRLVAERRIKGTPFTEGLLAVASDCLDRTPSELASAVEGLTGRASDTFEMEILHALKLNLTVP